MLEMLGNVHQFSFFTVLGKGPGFFTVLGKGPGSPRTFAKHRPHGRSTWGGRAPRACNTARDNKKSHIIQLHVRLAMRNDDQLNTGGLSGAWVHLLRASLSALPALLC